MPPTLPRFVALCGNPLSGKSTAGKLLESMGFGLVDDGGPMRKIAIEHFGFSHDDVYTQEGKLRTTKVNGVVMTWRDVVGRLGNALEHQFGADVIPELAYNAVPEGKNAYFGSVRREQGWYHANRGALVLEIRRPGAGPSPYEFDRFNAAAAHAVINNDGDLDQLEARLRAAVEVAACRAGADRRGHPALAVRR